MSVSVSMPQLGESVTEGTVTRWLKKEGERVERDEPLLEISTDKVDTEIPSPAAGILRGIAVAEDETVAVGAELALIDEDEGAAQPGAAPAQAGPAAGGPDSGPGALGGQDSGLGAPGGQDSGLGAPGGPDGPAQAPAAQEPAAPAPSAPAPSAAAPSAAAPSAAAPSAAAPSAAAPAAPAPAPPPQAQVPPPSAPPASQFQGPPVSAPPQEATAAPPPPSGPAAQPAAQAPPSGPPSPPVADGQAVDAGAPLLPAGPDGPYVTPLVRKLAAEHGVDLAQVSGTGVGGRIRKQDVLDAARARRDAGTAQAQQAPAPAAPGVPATQPAAAATRPDVVPSTLRGTTEHMSRLRQVIAQRMVESLQTSAQLTTVVEADVTEIARLRQRAKAEFEAREGVRLSFLPFFALAALEALKVHPKLNAVLDTQSSQITYHDAEHLGVAVDTERGLLVPVIRNAGDLNIGGLARKIADLAQRTRDGQVSPDELAGGTFTLTNTGSRGALFDTPIINQPQVAILGTGTVVKRPVVVEDPELGEVIAVRSVVYLALTYDHRLIDGADAARFLATVKNRLEEGAFEAELGL
jgi:pyruvate dehydrogenase E2 component (dihydrolipoyllysine-residue acetyltransferase)